MPAYVTHTLFSHLALHALLDAHHPLAGVALRHAPLFRVAGIAGCDIQCMPYQVCSACQAPYRHDQKESRRCMVCGQDALADFTFDVSNGTRLKRRDIERDLYANTHLVLYRSFRGYGVPPKTPSGPPHQPFPPQVIDHLAFALMDADRIAGPTGQVTNYLAFVLGWFSHVVSDAIFKGVYLHASRVNFFGTQYGMDMLPAAETLTMTDLAYDWGVHWPTWHEQLLADDPDGGALRHLAMGDQPEMYGPQWTDRHGKPDPAIGRVIDAVRPLNRRWFHQMYVQPDYTAATPLLDRRRIETRALHTFSDKQGKAWDLGQLRRYAIGTGWYQAFTRGVAIYLDAVSRATKQAKLDEPWPQWRQEHEHRPQKCISIGWNLWERTVNGAIAEQPRHAGEWGSLLELPPEAAGAIRNLRGQSANLIEGERPTDYQSALAHTLRTELGVKHDPAATSRIIIGPPAFNAAAADVLCQEDALRLKYHPGLAGLIRLKSRDGRTTLLICGFSDFGDHLLRAWLQRQALH